MTKYGWVSCNGGCASGHAFFLKCAQFDRSYRVVLLNSASGGFGFGFERFLYFSRKGRLASSKLT